MDMGKLGALLFLVVGLVNAVPPINRVLTEATGGTPVIQIIIGIACLIMAIALFMKQRVLS